jgi:putative hydrolase of the HAD superfamily
MQYGISFDFWNTLYANGDEDRRRQLRVAYFHRILSKYGNFSLDIIQEAFHESTHMFMDHWINDQRTPRPSERIHFMCDLIGVKIDQKGIDNSANYFGQVIDTIPPITIPALYDTITSLAKIYSLAIISDTGYISGNHIRRFLEKEKMLSLFKSQFFSDEHDHCKPHPSVFKLTCEKLNIECKRLIHIGDLEHTDVKGIKNVGGISIKFTGSNSSTTADSKADFVIDNYQDLPAIISKITHA